MKKLLTREEILNVRNFGIKEIDIPELQGSAYIRRWTGKDRAKFLQASVRVEDDNIGVKYETIFENMSLVVALSLCDEHGNRLFTDLPEDLSAIGDLDAEAIQKIYEESMNLNGLGVNSLAEAAKNSSPVQNDDSISA